VRVNCACLRQIAIKILCARVVEDAYSQCKAGDRRANTDGRQCQPCIAGLTEGL